MNNRARSVQAIVCAGATLAFWIGVSTWSWATEAHPAQILSKFHFPGDWRPQAPPGDGKKFPNAVVVTKDGPVKGTTSPEINAFLGIPYAAPPVGPLRWTPPQPHGRWRGVRDATQVGNQCPQPGFFRYASG